jgi:hypothetical protein
MTDEKPNNTDRLISIVAFFLPFILIILIIKMLEWL